MFSYIYIYIISNFFIIGYYKVFEYSSLCYTICPCGSPILFFKIFIRVQLNYNVVFVSNYSKVNQLYIHIDLLFFRFFSHISHFRVLSLVPCATAGPYQLSHLFCIYTLLHTTTICKIDVVTNTDLLQHKELDSIL